MRMHHLSESRAAGAGVAPMNAESDPAWKAIAVLIGRIIFAAMFLMGAGFKFAGMRGDRGLYRVGGISVPALPRLVRGDLRAAAGPRLPLRRVFQRGGAARRALRRLPGVRLPRPLALGRGPARAARVRRLHEPLPVRRRAALRGRARAGAMGAANDADRHAIRACAS